MYNYNCTSVSFNLSIVRATAKMLFGSSYVYTAENDADEIEEIEEEEDETIEEVRRRHQASRDDGQV